MTSAAKCLSRYPDSGPLMPWRAAGRQVSPLVQRGLILNERTGKAIKIGGATFNRLVLQARPCSSRESQKRCVELAATVPPAAARRQPHAVASVTGAHLCGLR